MSRFGRPELDWNKLNEDISRFGIRNATVTTIAPTGTISIVAGCSSGVEPNFAWKTTRRDSFGEVELLHPLYEAWIKAHPNEPLPNYFVTAHEITPEWHVRMQAAFQKYTDNAVSKCVVGDSMIYTDRGLIRIRDLYEDEHPDTFRPLSLVVADLDGSVEADRFYYGGSQPVVSLETDLGIRLGATPNHRVRVMEGGKIAWRRMDELKEGDSLIVPYSFGLFGNRYDFKDIYGAYYQPAARTSANKRHFPYKITTDLARLLGYLIADGGFNQNQVAFTQRDDRITEDYVQIVRERFGIEPHIALDPRREHLQEVTVNSRDLIAFFRDYLGTGRYAEDKHTPGCILASGPNIMKHFLRGLTLDGYVSNSGRMILLGTVSRQLAEEVQRMLLDLGIVARLDEKPINYEYQDETNRKPFIYEVAVLRNFRRAFLEQIGFSEERKQQKAWEKLNEKESEKWKVESGKCKEGFNFALRTSHFALGQKVIYSPITKVARSVEEVYDLRIPSTHSFITNGIVSHNTVNFPNSATRDDVREAYMLAYKLGCKGVTIYRDRSRDVQVLSVSKPPAEKEKEGEKKAEGAVLREPRPRPQITAGKTIKMKTGCGNLYITINEDEEGLCEVFSTMGKAGACTASQSEAISRLISLALRSRISVDAVLDDLTGISCPLPVWQNGVHILSCADAIGKAIQLYLDEKNGGNRAAQMKASEGEEMPGRRPGGTCPECGGMTEYVEGCVVCRSCGFSRCE